MRKVKKKRLKKQQLPCYVFSLIQKERCCINAATLFYNL